MGKLPDRSINPPFSASSFSRHRGGGGGLGTSAAAGASEFGNEKPSAAGPSQSQSLNNPSSQDANPLSRLTEDQREEINEAVCRPWQTPLVHAMDDNADADADVMPKFTLFDLDRDRHLDYHELRVAFRALGFTLSKQELISILTTYGVPRPSVQSQSQHHPQSQHAQKPPAGTTHPHPSNLLMPLSAFQSVTALKILERDPRDEILRAFELFDEGGKGFIDLEDLRRVARELGETGLEEEELRAMIEEFDLEGVGGVTREAFVGICWQ